MNEDALSKHKSTSRGEDAPDARSVPGNGVNANDSIQPGPGDRPDPGDRASSDSKMTAANKARHGNNPAADATTSKPTAKPTSKPTVRPTGMAALADDIRNWIADHPLSVLAVAVFAVANVVVWVVAAATGHRFPLTQLNTSLNAFDLTHLIGTLFLARGVLQLLIDVALLLVMFSLAEPLLGRVRLAGTVVASTAVGVAAGLALCAGVAALLQGTAVVDRLRFTLSPLALGVGALMAASAFSRPLWRHRMRLIGYTAIVAGLLFRGNPGDYCMLTAALAGQAMGVAMARHATRTATNAASPTNAAGTQTREPHVGWHPASSFEARRMFAAGELVMALGPILAITSPMHAGPLSSLGLMLSPVDPDNAKLAACLAGASHTGCFFQFDLLRTSMPGSVLRSLLPTAVMVIMAWGLYRGRRLAAWATVAFNAATAVLALAYYLVMPLSFAPDGFASLVRHGAVPACVVNTLLPAAFAALTAAHMRHFPIVTDIARIRRGFVAVAAAFVACAAVYLTFGLLDPDGFRPHATLADLLVELPGRFVPIGFLSHTRLRFMPDSMAASVVYQGVGLVFWLVVLVVCALWMRDILVLDEAGRARVEALVERGGESMSFMTTWEGNHYWFSDSGRSAVAYRVINGTALTCTGPFGDPSEWEDDLHAFAAFCEARSWTPAFYAVHRAQRDALVAGGWYSLEVGGEMVVDPRMWKTTGKKWQDIRTAINKAKKTGITDTLTTFEQAGPDVREQIEEISEQWAGEKALPEMKFTLGGVEELRDPRVRVLYAATEDGTVLGVTSWLPTWRDGRIVGWTLDFMRHRTDSPNGIMEFLIARMAERLRDEGQADPEHAVEFMSLSAAPLAGMNPDRDNVDANGREDTGTAMLQHAMQVVADLMEPAYGFHSLFNFKRKFQPNEEPVYVCYPDPAKLPQLGLAVMRAYVPSVSAAEAMAMIRTLQR